MSLERLIARGFTRRIEADIVAQRGNKHAVTHRLPVEQLVRRCGETWSVFERKSARA
jgi:hypothetical protein